MKKVLSAETVRCRRFIVESAQGRDRAVIGSDPAGNPAARDAHRERLRDLF